MYHKYKVLYVKTGEVFDRDFKDSDAVASHLSDRGLSEEEALQWVNKWNRQNATSGFVYWIE